MCRRFPAMKSDRILATKRRDPEADVSALERDHRSCGTGIDHLVYALYGLTKDEIKLVEENTKK